MVERVAEPAPVAAAEASGDKGSGEPGPGPSEPRRILKVYDLPSTLRRLDEWWDNYFAANNEGDASNDRLADGDWPPFPEGVAGTPGRP